MTLPLARVFPTRTSMSPTDRNAYFGLPDTLTPQYDEVHISVCFTWDLEKTQWLKAAWKKQAHTNNVKVSGPAFDGCGMDFVPGMYLRQGVVITSRGCPNKCPWCTVWRVEGGLHEIPITEGNIIQDNNILACSRSHQEKVFAMLKNQRRISFAGGLEAALVTDWVIEQLRGLRIKYLWLAYDHTGNAKVVQRAAQRLDKYFNRNKLRCYVLIGYGDDTIDKAEGRLRQAYEFGTMPFAMLYQPKEYSDDWKKFRRPWCRPAAIKAMMRAVDTGVPVAEQDRGQMALFER